MKGARIKYLREDIGLTQPQLAEKLKISSSAIAMYETDKREPSDDIKLKMCELFNCSMDYLVGRSDSRNSEIDTDKINIGLSTKDYNPPTEEQQKKIEEFAKFVLQENKKKKEEK